MTFSFRSFATEIEFAPESTKLSNLYIQATCRVPVLHFQWNGLPFSPATSDALRNGYFSSGAFVLFPWKEIKVNGGKWNHRTRCWIVDCGPILSRNVNYTSSLLQRVPVIHFSQCAPALPASRACFRKEIKCVDEECEFNEIPARSRRKETWENRYLSCSSLSWALRNYFISHLSRAHGHGNNDRL